MNMNEQKWLAVVDTFSNAPLTGDWLNALSTLSVATGSRAGELIGLGRANAVPFNWVSDLGPEYAEEFVALGGGNPDVNPFVRVGSQIPVLKVMASEEFITTRERRDNPFLIEHSARHDVAHACLAPLVKNDQMLVGLAVMRSPKQGEIKLHERKIFTSVAPHARAAVMTQLALENQGALLVAGTLEALSLTAFILDRRGMLKAMTPMAESLLATSKLLSLHRGFLCCTTPTETRTLTDAIDKVTGGIKDFGAPIASSLLMRDEKLRPHVLDVLPLPRRDYAFGFEPSALIIVRGNFQASSRDRTKQLISLAYGLTGAEADVALQLTDGLSPEEISTARAVSIGTIRTQIRSIYDKFGVNRFSELAASINRLY